MEGPMYQIRNEGNRSRAPSTQEKNSLANSMVPPSAMAGRRNIRCQMGGEFQLLEGARGEGRKIGTQKRGRVP